MNENEHGHRNIEKIVVYSPLLQTAAEQDANISYQETGDLSHPETVDKEIEDSEYRSKLPVDAGNISITVLALEELGDISVNIQFEGKRGLYNECLRNQSELLDAASGWIGEFLEQLGGDFDIVIEAKPCPFATERLPLKRVADNLARVEQTVQAKAVVGGSVVIKNDIKVSE